MYIDVDMVIKKIVEKGDHFTKARIYDVCKLGEKYVITTRILSSSNEGMIFHLGPQETECFYEWVTDHTLKGPTKIFRLGDGKLLVVYHYPREDRFILINVDFESKIVERYSVSDVRAETFGLR